jgi:GNAT superfamily N-acetyltransferase
LQVPAQPVYAVDPLERRHERDDFSCGVDALDRYLKRQARQDAEKHVAAAWVLTLPPALDVLGFYTLSAASIPLSDLPASLTKRLPKYPSLPVVLLGRLAVDARQVGRGLGEFLLMDALRRSLDGAKHIAAMAVIVDAKDNRAASFYASYGFAPLPEHERRMFLPMTQVYEVLGD